MFGRFFEDVGETKMVIDDGMPPLPMYVAINERHGS